MTYILRLKVEAALREGAAHLLRLVTGTQQLAPVFPLAPGALAGLADETVALLDQFIYRFINWKPCFLRRAPIMMRNWRRWPPDKEREMMNCLFNTSQTARSKFVRHGRMY
jgi:hypothetical protein